MNQQYHFFWQAQSVFSNWYAYDFDHNGIWFNCAEQAMMFEKAIAFDDKETAKEILRTNNPRDQKALGKQVKRFNSETWDSVKYETVKSILRSKFQSQMMQNYLLKYKGLTFVEASPYDRIWGIGFTESDALPNIANWGENLLGKMLTEISNEI